MDLTIAIATVVTAVATVITAAATFVTVLFGYKRIVDQGPSFETKVKELAFESSDVDAIRLRQKGLYRLRLKVQSTPVNWRITAVRIKGAQIPKVFTDHIGHWQANRYSTHDEIAMTHGKVKTNWQILQNDLLEWEIIIQPDNPKAGRLYLELFTTFGIKISVPFEYKQSSEPLPTMGF